MRCGARGAYAPRARRAAYPPPSISPAMQGIAGTKERPGQHTGAFLRSPFQVLRLACTLFELPPARACVSVQVERTTAWNPVESCG